MVSCTVAETSWTEQSDFVMWTGTGFFWFLLEAVSYVGVQCL